jgi:hypothetical protein
LHPQGSGHFLAKTLICWYQFESGKERQPSARKKLARKVSGKFEESILS